MKPIVTRNARALDLWIEGVELDSFCASFLLAAVENRIGEEAAALLGRLSNLRERTRELFAETYAAVSVEEELDMRYGFQEAYLRGIAT